MSNQSMYSKAFWNAMRGKEDNYSDIKNMTDSTSSYPAPYEFLIGYTPSLEKKISLEELEL